MLPGLQGLWPVSDLGSGPTPGSNSRYLVCCLASETHMHSPGVSRDLTNDLMGSPPEVLSLNHLLVLSGTLHPPLWDRRPEHWGCIYLSRPTTRTSKAKRRQAEKREAAGTCPHPLETTALVTEEGSLPSQFLVFGVLAATMLTTRTSVSRFPSLN